MSLICPWHVLAMAQMRGARGLPLQADEVQDGRGLWVLRGRDILGHTRDILGHIRDILGHIRDVLMKFKTAEGFEFYEVPICVWEHIGHIRDILGHVRDILGHIRDILGHIRALSSTRCLYESALCQQMRTCSVCVWEHKRHIRDILGHVRDVLGHIRDILGHIRDILGHIRDILGHIRDILGHIRDILGHIRDTRRY